jgi:hypothetical protein
VVATTRIAEPIKRTSFRSRLLGRIRLEAARRSLLARTTGTWIKRVGVDEEVA